MPGRRLPNVSFALLYARWVASPNGDVAPVWTKPCPDNLIAMTQGRGHRAAGSSVPDLRDLAACREKPGDLAGAEAAVRDVLRREPDNPTALNVLGYLWADHNRNLGQAVELIARALAQDPDNGAFLDSLGWAYYRLGRLGDAQVQLERAARLTGGDPVVLEHLGDVYNDLALKDLAREQYRQCLAGDPANGRVRAKLDSLR